MNQDIRKIFLGLPLAILSFSAVADRSEGRPHVLFIAIDDLRPELGCYGSPIAKSPNLDKLAAEGMRFDRAYCQQSICSPSRASLMTGARPDRIGVIENTAYFRELNPEIVTLPQHFIKHGYEAVYCGKIYHGRMTDADLSWSRKPAFNRCPVKMKGLPGNYALKANQELWASNKEKMLAKYGKAGSGGLIHGPAYESADVPDHTYPDGYSTRLAIATLKDHREKKPKQPLFLALGFKKPHLDFVAPKKYWDLYDRDKIQLAKQTIGPKRGAATGLHASFELRTRHGIPKKGPIGPELAKTLLHGYYACVSYVDALVGRLLKQLETSGLAENTVVCLWGDHGFHLGEQGLWTKANNYELSARVPLFFRYPKKTKADKRSGALVELVDVYPTLVQLCGLKAPSGLEGISLTPLMEKPGRKWKSAAFTQYPRSWKSHRHRGPGDVMGYAVRTDTHRYVEWREGMDGKVLHRELYDHRKDPQEMKNVAGLKKNAQSLAKLVEILANGWRWALPPDSTKP